MSNSTKRAIRTAVHAVFAVVMVGAVVLPLGVSSLPALAVLAPVAGGFVTASAIVAKVWNALEDRGVLPAWLKGADDVSSELASADAVAAVIDPESMGH